MIGKIAINNFKKNTKEFLIYFLTLVFGVCLFYAFNSLDSQQVMQNVSERQQEIVKSFVKIVGVISIFISVILGFLVLYANKFLIKRRKKEFGIYMTLGMQKYKISQIIVIETLIVGIMSLFVGLLLGILLSQGMSVLTAKLFEVNLNSFRFVFSIAALRKTVIYFAIIFLVVMIFNTISISRYKLIDLIYADKKNEKLKFKHLIVPVILFVISVLVLAYSYVRIIKFGIYRFDRQFTLTVILGSIGTILFFLSLAGFALKLIQLNKKMYYRGLNMFILRQINSKINTNYISMSLVCLMLFVTILSLSGGFTIANIFSNDIKKSTPFDASIYIYNNKNDKNFSGLNILKKYNTDLEQVSNSYNELKLYSIDNLPYTQIIRGVEDKKINELLQKQDIQVVSISDINKIFAMQNHKKLDLGSDQFYILCNVDFVKKYCNNFLEQEGKITIDSQNLNAASTKVIDDFALEDAASTSDIVVIVPDNLVKNLTFNMSIIDINYISQDENHEQKFNDMMKTVETMQQQDTSKEAYIVSITKTTLYDQSVGLKVMITYISIYIGIVFLITSAAILALQQLIEASDNTKRYLLLKKIGTEKAMINKAIFIQVCIYFLVPLVLAIVHSIIGIKVINDTFKLLGETGIFVNVSLTAIITVIVYGGYMFATYVSSKNMFINYDRS